MNLLTSISNPIKYNTSFTPSYPPTYSAKFSSGNYMISGNSSALTFSSLSQLTIEFWINITNFGSSSYIIPITFANANSTTKDGFNLQFSNNYQITLNLPFVFAQSSNANVFSLNTWTHICIQIVNGTIVLYVNGTQRVSRAFSNFSTLNNNQMGLNCGFTSNPVENYMNGYIGDVRISNVALYTNAQGNNITSFTPPNQALQVLSSTLMLLTTTSSSDILTDKSSNAISRTFYNSSGIVYDSSKPYA